MNFLLEKVENQYLNEFDLTLLNQKQIILFKNEHNQISSKKKEIDKEHIIKYWDKMKKIGNPYELVYTTYNKKRKNDSISDYTPISRSYFKLWEIFNNYDIFKYTKNKLKINCAHLAEGPGGFMEASINYLNQLGKKNSSFWGLTLKPNDQYVPDWNKIKKFCKERKNCFIEYGDLYEYEDVLSFVFKLSNYKMDLVTADGGFDYSQDFNGQELNSCQILYSEIVVGLNILNKNGSFVIKFFDLFSITSIQLIHLLNYHFEEVYIYKPETSRQANSEKYIVCLYFKDNLNYDYKEKLLLNIKKWSDLNKTKKKDEYIIINNFRYNNNLIRNVNNINKKYILNQVNYINFILNMIEKKLLKDEYHDILKKQVLKAIEWCKKYNIPINKNSIYYQKNNF